MKKIPSLFIRDWEHDPSRVKQEINPSCKWVVNGEGVPTRKRDGTACLVKKGILYKRYNRKRYKKGSKKGQFKPEPKGWIKIQEPDEKTGHWFGWVLVDFNEPTNKWFKIAWESLDTILEDNTYELCGPKVQGNSEKLEKITFIKHGSEVLEFNGRTYDEIKDFLSITEIEGIVWHHEDGRMAKIKRVDFGYNWS